MMVSKPAPTEVWKYIATTAVAVLLTVGAFTFKESREIKGITPEEFRNEIGALVRDNNPYTGDQKEIAAHLASIDRTLTIMQARQEQQASDIAIIAATTHTPAHPLKNDIR